MAGEPVGWNLWTAPDEANTGAWALDPTLAVPSWTLKRAFLDMLKYADNAALVHANMRLLTDDNVTQALLSPPIAGTNPVQYGPVHCWQVSLKTINDSQLSQGLKGFNKRLYTFLIVGLRGVADVGTHAGSTNTPPSEIDLEKITGDISIAVARYYRILVNYYGQYSIHIIDFPVWTLDYQNFETMGNLLVHRVRGEFVVELEFSRDPNGGPLGG
jgi:hypothetical protein